MTLAWLQRSGDSASIRSPFPRFSRSDRQGEASIGCQRSARDVTGLVRAQEDNRHGDLFGASYAPRVNTLLQNLVVESVADDPSEPPMHRRVNDCRASEVDPDTLRRQLRRHARCQPDQAVFRGDIGRSGREAEEGVDGADVDDARLTQTWSRQPHTRRLRPLPRPKRAG